MATIENKKSQLTQTWRNFWVVIFLWDVIMNLLLLFIYFISSLSMLILCVSFSWYLIIIDPVCRTFVMSRGHWMVLIDAAKGCVTQPPDLSKFPADFVVMSFYKVDLYTFKEKMNNNQKVLIVFLCIVLSRYLVIQLDLALSLYEMVSNKFWWKVLISKLLGTVLDIMYFI